METAAHFDQFKIKTYTLWDLFLAEQQYPYLGRCYAWARREDANLVTDMTRGERDELFDAIIPAWSGAVDTLFGSHRPNVAILGNTSPHLHVHLIPRYKDTLQQYGFSFTDPNPSGNYAPYPKKSLPLDILHTIRDDIGRLL